MRISGIQMVHEGGRGFIDDIAVVVLANAPTIENHKKSFLCHGYLLLLFVDSLDFEGYFLLFFLEAFDFPFNVGQEGVALLRT